MYIDAFIAASQVENLKEIADHSRAKNDKL